MLLFNTLIKSLRSLHSVFSPYSPRSPSQIHPTYLPLPPPCRLLSHNPLTQACATHTWGDIHWSGASSPEPTTSSRSEPPSPTATCCPQLLGGGENKLVCADGCLALRSDCQRLLGFELKSLVLKESLFFPRWDSLLAPIISFAYHTNKFFCYTVLHIKFYYISFAIITTYGFLIDHSYFWSFLVYIFLPFTGLYC